jgi:hypothetical protein
MESTPPPVSPTLRNHKRQVIWQIVVPFALLAALVMTATGFVVAGNGGADTGLWRDVALIWFLVPGLALALVLLIVLSAAIYGLFRLEKAVPPLTARAQQLARQGEGSVRRIADGAASPFMLLKQVGAVLRSLYKR